ncbi:Lpg1974 family pore-forming outer membrane protein [Legionella clemsonensis]|uniref:Legionella pneumophila major outer membrane protein n=1 Tax=Legionella clemsonensis TaxID=1867846 RepID=A0A222P3N3_9GAMM|nr:Lpg1974 family pore-forming outer membrane protein [Legionella clemsonensis]ASQ46464.1 Legionella pneumophila major outer membrane protein precursor [Legionella clemsonensis]
MFKPYLFSGLLLIANTSYSGTMGCQTEGVTVPCENRAWDIGIGALYLKPTSPLLNPYLRSGILINDLHYHSVKSPWDWGFMAEGSYHFNTGNDVNVNWLHFNDKYNDSVSAFFPEASIPRTQTAYLNFKTRLDVVNVEFAQNSHLGSKTNLRLHGGLQYANGNIDRDIQQYEQILTFPTSLFHTASLEATYRGLGPRLGGDISRQLPHGFAVFAKSAMALLVGEAKTKLSGNNLSGPRITPFSRYVKQTSLVPELETKLGASYEFNAGMGQVTLLAGWLFQHYFNLFSLASGEFPQRFNEPVSHELSLNGPFIQGKWVADV